MNSYNLYYRMQSEGSREQSNPQHLPSFFLFINSGSGSGLGTKLISQEIEKIQFVIPVNSAKDQRRCEVYFYNMRANRDKGFLRLKSEVEGGHKCCVIVCGGDGTVIWIITQLVKHQIDVHKVPLGIIPLGTGNDFSRDLGWGPIKTELIENSFRSLKKLIRLWSNAREEYFDIWDFEAQVFQNGKFEKIENEENHEIEGKVFRKQFCNYFSFGIDGKIGYSFDLHRQKTRLGNLAMYSMLGVAKTVTSTKTIDELVETIEFPEASSSSLPSDKLSTSKVFRSQSQKQIPDSEKQFSKGYYNMLFLNINSYTGGVKDIWHNAKLGFLNDHQYKEQPVSTSDGKIEVVSFSSSFAIAMERTFSGFATKVAQSEGPFTFNFRRNETEPKHRTYLQIDGEFIRFTHPKMVTVKQSSLVPQGKIKILRRNPNYQPFIPE